MRASTKDLYYLILVICPEDAENWYMDYRRLTNQHHLFLLYRRIKYQFPSFIKLFGLLRNAGITERHAVNFINNSNQIPDLQKCSELANNLKESYCTSTGNHRAAALISTNGTSTFNQSFRHCIFYIYHDRIDYHMY